MYPWKNVFWILDPFSYCVERDIVKFPLEIVIAHLRVVMAYNQGRKWLCLSQIFGREIQGCDYTYRISRHQPSQWRLHNVLSLLDWLANCYLSTEHNLWLTRNISNFKKFRNYGGVTQCVIKVPFEWAIPRNVRLCAKIWETEMNFFDFSHRHQPVP